MLYCARLAMTHCRPAMTTDTSVEPSAGATFTDTRFAAGATPAHRPLDSVPSPAMMPAMCVP